jgi:glycosyltransferase involved in cell wall biosynthesis
MSKNKTKIIVDVERMKHPYTGLFYYCKNLAVNLEKYHSDTFDFHFFAYPKAPFPSHLKRMNRTQLDKFYLTKPRKYKLWHATWQDTKYVPRNNMKFVYTIHDLNFLYTDKPEYKKKKLLQAVQEKIDRADAITVISNFVKNDVEKNLDLKGKKIDVIYNGVEVNEYPEFDNPRYRPSGKFLFTVGTVLFKKHFHVLPALLVNNDFELVIGGIHPDPEYIKKIWKEAEKYGVKDRVKLTGPITDEEKYWYMKNSEAFLFPSISEGFGLPPIEAMRLGKPVFLSTLTSLPEVGGKHAYYFENFTPEHMQKVLEEGLRDYNENNRKEGIIKWSEQFNWKKAVSDYVDVYKRVLEASNYPEKKNLKKK